MMMTCREVRDFLVDYIVGDVSSTERRELERHLQICESCTNCVETGFHMRVLSKAAIAQLDDPSASDVPGSLVRAIMDAQIAQSVNPLAAPRGNAFPVHFSDVPIRL